MIKIAPSILAADFTRLETQIREAEASGADWIHVDVMDGQYVPNLTFGPIIVRALRKMTSLPLDVHLMVFEPDHLIPAFIEAGATNITVHIEAIRHIHRTIGLIKQHGANTGITLNPGTSASLLDSMIHEIDLILLMSVNPGFGGQTFIHRTLEKIKTVREMADKTGKYIDIEVDGGVDVNTAPLIVKAGANVLVAGTSIFGQDDISVAIDKLRQSVQGV
ncbi:ribulose-phosphate 3-epimerase [candidate division KSB1 bacterium]|nr:ribulose-phosphate 3-epimerase [candidate division KSB1 bacterium]